ncbi:MAG TPA: outer membrane lipoprotein-sorting protein [Terriglobia bacterium]|nr:outer membrane lipoprotein-sorting protein [Terriglobia bacterium]
MLVKDWMIHIMARPRRLGELKWISLILITSFLAVLATNVHAMTAQEILEQVDKQSFSDNFRVSLTFKAFKGNKVISSRALWLMAKVQEGKGSYFLDFYEPKESNGLRYLFLEQAGQEPSAYMYLPGTYKTMPVAADDPSVDVGGTGITTEDLQRFLGKAEAEKAVLREEPLDGRECYVIKIPISQTKGERLQWVSKDNFLMLKSQHLDGQGNILRTFMVTKFFKTLQGKEFPWEEEITVPAKGVRITVRQDSAVFGIEIPDEVTDPQKFGTFRWKGWTH